MASLIKKATIEAGRDRTPLKGCVPVVPVPVPSRSRLWRDKLGHLSRLSRSVWLIERISHVPPS